MVMVSDRSGIRGGSEEFKKNMNKTCNNSYKPQCCQKL